LQNTIKQKLIKRINKMIKYLLNLFNNSKKEPITLRFDRPVKLIKHPRGFEIKYLNERKK
tara:strand:- start:272 stop:451 length:180 start_codon:yes stop_codon:yes gene_type:complete